MAARLAPLAVPLLLASFAGCASPNEFAGSPDCDEAPVSSVTHVHGLAVSPENRSVVFVATHHGLFRLLGDERFVRVGDVTWDLMGFTLHPEDASVAWSSGHAPPARPNIGVAKTDDGGCTWKVIGLKGLVDFHALAVSPADPQRLFGQYDLFYVSSNGGERWTSVQGAPRAFALAPHPSDPDIVLAATENGLYRSGDAGRTWTADAELPGLVTAVGFARGDANLLVAYVSQRGLVRSQDGGASWEDANLPLVGNEVGRHVASAPDDPDVFYLATSNSRLFKSEDRGETWAQVPRSGR